MLREEGGGFCRLWPSARVAGAHPPRRLGLWWQDDLSGGRCCLACISSEARFASTFTLPNDGAGGVMADRRGRR